MSDISINNKRIAKNTIALYFRSLLSLFVGLFSVRIVLKVLGENDYGIYSVIGGLLAFFTFISAALYAGNQRFFSFYIGKKDKNGLKYIFGISLTVYLIFALCIFIFGELIGVWYINTYLNIEPGRLFAANVIFQFSIISSSFGLLGAPYSSAIMANEDMHVFGWIAIYDAIVKLLICYLLVVSPWDKLISYSLLLAIAGVISTTFTIVYSHLKYRECGFRPLWNKAKIKELTSFSGWNLFGSFGWIVKNQGLSLVLNLFFGSIVNTAQGIAMSVRNYSAIFSTNFSNAVAPQIVKNYAAFDYSKLVPLLYRSCKMTFFLMLIVVAPLFFYMDSILSFWVGEHSDIMTVFCQIMIIEALIDSVSYPMASANQATGKIAIYQGLIGLFEFLTLPAAYILLKFGLSPIYAFIASLVSQIFVVGVRTIFLYRVFPGAVKGTIQNVYIPCLIVSIIVFIICFIIKIDAKSLSNCILALVLNFVACIIIIWFFGLTFDEKVKIKGILINKLKIKLKEN